MSEKIRKLETSARRTVLRAAETKVGERVLTGRTGQAALLAARRVIRTSYEHSIPEGRLLMWTAATLAQEAVHRGAIQKPTELELLIKKLSERKLKNVLEIGTGVGGMAFVLCHVAEPDAAITTVGIQKSKTGDTYGPRLERCINSYASKDQRLNLLKGDSHVPLVRRKVSETVGDDLDLLFIDGDHSLSGISSDFLDYTPLVRSDGLIVIHDTMRNPLNPACEVHRFWDDHKADFQFAQIEDAAAGKWGGYGIIEA
jgi:predicted O-methyltransferase YrrM